MKTLTDYSLTELKLIYSLLHNQVAEYPDLMDSDLLQDLQTQLQKQATQDGVDVSTHADWAGWLNNIAS
jgi:hypothetical protein